jgi:putative hemolysin
MILALIGCLLSIGFVSSMETALLGVPLTKLRSAYDRKDPQAQPFKLWLTRPGDVLTTLHFLRLCLIVAAGIIAARIFLAHHNDFWIDVSIVLGVASVALMFGNIIPRSLAKLWPYEWARLCMPIVKLFVYVLFPLIVPFTFATQLLSKITGKTFSSAYWTPEELDRMHAQARSEALGKPNEELFKSILEFSDTVIKEIMVPRTAMIAVTVTSTPDEILKTVVEAGHSRIPVYEDTIDNIVGLLHVKELFALLLMKKYDQRVEVDIKKILRPTFYVPEVMQISELLREFQKRKTHMAIAVDEYGGTAGCVTLEDIIEEIVGEIQDEYDVEEKQFRVLADNKIIADARVHVSDLETALNITFPEDGGFETLAGFITTQLGYIPQAGAVLTWKDLRFTIKEANERRIGMVEIERKAA